MSSCITTGVETLGFRPFSVSSFFSPAVLLLLSSSFPSSPRSSLLLSSAPLLLNVSCPDLTLTSSLIRSLFFASGFTFSEGPSYSPHESVYFTFVVGSTNVFNRGERIIRYSNIIRILEAEYLYSYSYSGNFFKPNNIHIRIWVIFKTEY